MLLPSACQQALMENIFSQILEIFALPLLVTFIPQCLSGAGSVP